MPENNTEDKICHRCGELKSLNNYYPCWSGKDGKETICKSCRNTKRQNQRELPGHRERDKIIYQKLQDNGYFRIYSSKPEVKFKNKVRKITRDAVKSGILQRLPCFMYNSENVESHHYDYSKPLDVIWLCHKCHTQLHKLSRYLEGKK